MRIKLNHTVCIFFLSLPLASIAQNDRAPDDLQARNPGYADHIDKIGALGGEVNVDTGEITREASYWALFENDFARDCGYQLQPQIAMFRTREECRDYAQDRYRGSHTA